MYPQVPQSYTDAIEKAITPELADLTQNEIKLVLRGAKLASSVFTQLRPLEDSKETALGLLALISVLEMKSL